MLAQRVPYNNVLPSLSFTFYVFLSERLEIERSIGGVQKDCDGWLKAIFCTVTGSRCNENCWMLRKDVNSIIGSNP